MGEGTVLLSTALFQDTCLGFSDVSVTHSATGIGKPFNPPLPRADTITSGGFFPVFPRSELAVLWDTAGTGQGQIFAARIVHLVGFAASAHPGHVADSVQGVVRRGAKGFELTAPFQAPAGAAGGAASPFLPVAPNAPERLFLGAFVALSHLS